MVYKKPSALLFVQSPKPAGLIAHIIEKSMYLCLLGATSTYEQLFNKPVFFFKSVFLFFCFKNTNTLCVTQE